jgi:hypothetical protein
VRRGVRSIALVGVLCACQGLERASQETARNLARDVEQLVSEDKAAEALLLIEEALASAPQDARLRFVEGWYHNALADRPGFDRRARLASAERAYARAVELQADYRSAIYNWAIVLDELEKLAVAPVRPDGSARPGALETIARIVDRVPVDRITYDALLVQGDVLARHARAASVAETFAAALRAYGRAEDSRPASVAARRRRTALLMELCDLDPQGGVASDPEGGWAQRLRSASDADFAEGFDELASAGFHFLVAHCMDDPEGALDSWLIARARLGVLTSRELPAAEFRACAAVTPAVDGLERRWADPVALAQDLRRQPDDYWMSSDARRVAIALALQAEAQRRSLQAASSPVDDPDTDLDEGAERRALLEDARALLDAGARAAPPDEEAIAPDESAVRFDVALDLLLLYYTYPALRDGPQGDRLWALLQDRPLDRFADPDRWDAVTQSLSATGKDLVRIHTALGEIFAETTGWSSLAQLHLARARERAAEDWSALRQPGREREYELARARAEARGIVTSEEHPAPHLAERIGAGLTAEHARGRGPGDAYLEAARGYLEGGATSLAYDLYHDAREPRDIADARFQDLEQLLYTKYGWYLGVSTGYAIGGSQTELRETLTLQGHAITDLDLSDPEAGLRVAAGYRFRGSWAAELAYVDLGEYTSVVETKDPPAQVARALEREHPLTGVGLSAGLKNFVYDRRRVGLYAKAGLWLWEADLEVAEVNGNSVRIDEWGIDPFIGLGLQYRIAPRVYLRGEAERYYLDDDQVDFLTLGLQFNLGGG